MDISLEPIERIIPYARNPRVNDSAIAKVAASIKEFGWRQPIVVDKDMVVVAGHTRLLAARQLGFESVPVHVAESLTKHQVKAYRLADNRTHEDSKWDEELLGIELGDLKASDFDLSITGFDADELNELIAQDNVSFTDEDNAPEEPSVATSKLGDIWLLGEHKLICADALDAESYKLLLGDTQADMVFTDPPYNVNYVGGARERSEGLGKASILNDHLGDNFDTFLKATCKNLISSCRGAIYISMGASELDKLRAAFVEAGGHWSTFIIWAKNHFTLCNSDYQKQFEPILYGWPKGKKHFWCGARDQSDVWFFNKPNSSDLHPTMKPVELVEQAIKNSSKSGDIVLDAFGGSGSTLIACEKIGRKCRMMELEPKYCDVIIKRWQSFAGKLSILLSTGQTFESLKSTQAN